MAFTGHNIPWRRELEIVTATTGTADFQRLSAPHRIMVMGFAHKRMRGLMEQGIANFRFWRAFGEFVRQGNDVGRVVTNMRPFFHVGRSMGLFPRR